LKAQYNPRISETLNRFATIARGEEEWIEQHIAPILKQSILSIDADKMILSVSKISKRHTALKKRILRRAIALVKGNTRGITFSHIDAVIKLVEFGPRFGSLDLPDRIRIHRNDDTIRISKNKFPRRKTPFFPVDFGLEGFSNKQCAFQYQIHEPGAVDVKEAGIRLEFSELRQAGFGEMHRTGGRVAFFDMATLHFPMVIRNVLPGDRFTPLGMTGTQKLKKFFINNKVPRSKRLKCPVVVSRGKIIWVVGYRIDDAVKVTRSTGNVLKAELFLA
jgi:tRNA(Ile)-lysidine synthase